jgi:oxygen-independent coproporphyrinogen-3 oxidase
MAGIYIHIPFCRKRCHYCDFYKTTDFGQKFRLVKSLITELENHSQELADEEIHTVYLGGGTPSVLQVNELNDLLDTIWKNYRLHPNAEITIEANPDDINELKFKAIREIGYNRISIGIQSFADSDLKLMNRRHDSEQAIQAVEIVKNAGFKNISIDLIYGLPNQNLQEWERNVRMAVDLDVQHISAYHLTYHEGTVFYDQLKKGHLKELPDEISLQQFEILIDVLKHAGFEHYEISNFCQPGFYSRHNSSYWKGEKYLGIGPSAHSFDLKSRRWNVSSISKYLEGVENGKSFYEAEILSEQDRYNEYIITGLRTIWGISDQLVSTTFPEKYVVHFRKILKKYLESGHIQEQPERITLSREGLFISDQIMADFMMVEAC